MGNNLSYADAGVNIDVTDAAKKAIAKSVNSDDRRVLNKFGAFASLVEGRFEGYEHPVLMLKTEEPGSKQKLAFQYGYVSSIAYDLINHLVNDLTVMGGEPLYVQDCIICGSIDPAVIKTLVSSMADACRAQGCVLTDGETSVQPGVLNDGTYVLSASAVGVVDKAKIVDGSGIASGDVVIAVASNGLHTNGYSLVRKLLERRPSLAEDRIGDESFMDVIMKPHVCYYRAARGLFSRPLHKGIAHITGGGVQGNLNRILPRHCDASIDLARIRVPEVFKVIRKEGNVTDAEMLRTFNMGIGLAIVCSKPHTMDVVGHLEGQGCVACEIGNITQGTGNVNLHGTVAW